jgi:hypothetical protein
MKIKLLQYTGKKVKKKNREKYTKREQGDHISLFFKKKLEKCPINEIRI